MVASNTVALNLARFYGKTCCHCHLIPVLGADCVQSATSSPERLRMPFVCLHGDIFILFN